MDTYRSPPRSPAQPHYLPRPQGKRSAALAKPVSVYLLYYTDDVMLTCESLSDLEQAAGTLITPPGAVRIGDECTEVQGPGFSVQLLGVTWAGKTKVMPGQLLTKYKLFPFSHLFPSYFGEPRGLLVTLHPPLGPNP